MGLGMRSQAKYGMVVKANIMGRKVRIQLLGDRTRLRTSNVYGSAIKGDVLGIVCRCTTCHSLDYPFN